MSLEYITKEHPNGQIEKILVETEAPNVDPALPIVYIDIPNSGQVINLGSTFDFTCTFSDETINGNIPVSVVNRDGIHVENLLVTVVDGSGVGSFTPPQPIDYFVTDEAINFHKEVIPNELKLTSEFYIRVVQSI